MSDIRDMAAKLFSAIEEIDVKLDSRDDSGSATKTKVVNDLVEANKPIWEQPATQLIEQFRNLEPDVLAGVFNGLVKELRQNFDAAVKETVEKMAEEAPKVEPLISEDEVAPLQKTRSELYQQFKMAATLLEQMEGEKLTMPKTRRGSKGKRGKRALTLMEWSINGETIPDEVKTYKDLAIFLGFEGSKELTAFLKSQNVNTTNPEDGVIDVNLADGRALHGELPSDEEDEESEEDED